MIRTTDQPGQGLLERQIQMLGSAYGGSPFWSEVLQEDTNPDNVWRALLFIASQPDLGGLTDAIRLRLRDADSRVRAWACFAMSRSSAQHEVDRLHKLLTDPSPRVYFHAAQACRHILADNHSLRRLHKQIRPSAPVVLVSDDSEEVRDVVGAALSDLGFRVALAADTEETLREALRLRPAAVVMDNQKGTDNLAGVSMAREFTETPELRETVLFMLSADAIPGPFLWNGGHCFLPKNDTDPDAWRSTIAQYLLD